MLAFRYQDHVMLALTYSSQYRAQLAMIIVPGVKHILYDVNENKLKLQITLLGLDSVSIVMRLRVSSFEHLLNV